MDGVRAGAAAGSKNSLNQRGTVLLGARAPLPALSAKREQLSGAPPSRVLSKYLQACGAVRAGRRAPSN